MSDDTQVLEQFFRTHSDARGIPSISPADWAQFSAQYPKKLIQQALARYIQADQVPFPLKEISWSEFVEAFYRLRNTSMLDLYKHDPAARARATYEHDFDQWGIAVIGSSSHHYNLVSDYFQQANRMKCGSWRQPSPWEYWSNPVQCQRMNWHFWRPGAMRGHAVDESTFREAFRIGTYTATQFKPAVAKALYERHSAVNIVDTSSGWGDRLAGFYTTPGTRVYVGCDPNSQVYEVYKDQCLAYERLLGHQAQLTEHEDHFVCRGEKTVTIWNLPSEDVDWGQYPEFFDFYFTSPPYFDTEKYGTQDINHARQSWARYTTFEQWQQFFFVVNHSIWKTLAPGGWAMLNIIDPRTGKYALCDHMIRTISTYPQAHFLGMIGMQLHPRPHEIKQVKETQIEPIWVFRRGRAQYEFVEKNQFSQLFDVD